ncbi:MAG: succinate dehydrogenase [Planctomycetaceae bacterium]
MPQTMSAAATDSVFQTQRKDGWWAGPLVTAGLLLAFIVWATYRAFENGFYKWGEYLSPFFSPLIEGFILPPAFLILWAPAGFRVTCYYYRKAYYRSLFLTPPACAVRGAQKSYKGETFLLFFQNLHRYLFYVAFLFLVFLWHDAVVSYRFDGKFGVGVGSLVLTLNAAFLSLYTLSCHCWRHLVGGGMNCFVLPTGKPKLRYRVWQRVSFLNARHMQFAWVSLVWVGFSDIYVRMVAMGSWRDLRIL